MESLRVILAPVLAILIANPLCCCAAAEDPSKSVASCCGHTQGDSHAPADSPDDHACACSTHAPGETMETAVHSDPLPAVDFVKIQPESLLARAPSRTLQANNQSRFPGCDPPRALLSRISRWLN